MQSVVLPNHKEIQYRVVPFRKRLWMQRQLILMSVPMLLYILLFNYFPIWGWITAFMNYNPAKPLFSNEWVGIENFVWLFSKPEFIRAIRNTFAMAAINLVFGFVFPITLALFLNEIRSRRFKRTVQDRYVSAAFPQLGYRRGHRSNDFSQRRCDQSPAAILGHCRRSHLLSRRGQVLLVACRRHSLVEGMWLEYHHLSRGDGRDRPRCYTRLPI